MLNLKSVIAPVVVFLIVAMTATALLALEQETQGVSGGGLWVSSEVCSSFLTEFQGKSIARTGTPKPTLKPLVSRDGKVGAIRFDTQQNAFISFCGGVPLVNGVVLALPPSAIHAFKSGHPKRATATVVINDASVDCP